MPFTVSLENDWDLEKRITRPCPVESDELGAIEQKTRNSFGLTIRESCQGEKQTATQKRSGGRE
jgi:hypothetical protein